MEIEQDEPINNNCLEDVGRLISFVKVHHNTLSEYIRVARMYLFGTPIRRAGSTFRCVTPGCIRLKLYSSKQNPGDSVAVVDDEVDFPLEPNGDLNFHRVKLWWGVHLCAALEPYSWKVFKPRNADVISGIAVHNLTAGWRSKIDLIDGSSRAHREGRIQTRRTRHLVARAQMAASCGHGRPRVVLEPARCPLRAFLVALPRPGRNPRSRVRDHRPLPPPLGRGALDARAQACDNGPGANGAFFAVRVIFLVVRRRHTILLFGSCAPSTPCTRTMHTLIDLCFHHHVFPIRFPYASV
ncbi:hypothetical protein F5148DRAFT_75102 [Russula earlei]|uniref:Uncharacterized protein n=1 Tax=Russula earlei TaxID=71964 RepID=A0ACC0U7Q2_9AGAM|nr:hypothetical protein F5148DRAFT_75102 [Russula earlei]